MESAPAPVEQHRSCPRGPAGAARAFHDPLPVAGDRRLDRIDDLRRLRGRAALVTVVSEPRRSRQACLRGEPADAEDARGRRPVSEHGRLPLLECRPQREPGGAPGDGAGGEGDSRRAHELVLLDRQPDVRVRGRAYDVPAGLSPRPRRPRREERRRGHPGRGRSGASGRDQRRSDRARCARRSEHHLDRRIQRPAGGPDRRSRCADHPPLRLRDAARGGDAPRRRDRGDSQHVHARLDPDLPDRRLDHRAVPDRAGRPRRRDRLRAPDDLPLPRRAARGERRRDGARRDDDPRRPLGDHLRHDRGDRAPGDGSPAAAVAALDGHRRHADPRRLGDSRR